MRMGSRKPDSRRAQIHRRRRRPPSRKREDHSGQLPLNSVTAQIPLLAARFKRMQSKRGPISGYMHCHRGFGGIQRRKVLTAAPVQTVDLIGINLADVLGRPFVDMTEEKRSSDFSLRWTP